MRRCRLTIKNVSGLLIVGQGNALAKAQVIKFILDAGNREQKGFEGAGGLGGTKTARKQACYRISTVSTENVQ